MIASSVQLWLDVRHGTAVDTAGWSTRSSPRCGEEAAAEGARSSCSGSRCTERVSFDPALGLQLSELLGAPIIPTGAGHDAGVLAGTCADRDAVRAQPDRRVARTGRARGRGRLPSPGIDALADVLEDLGGEAPG